MNSQDSLLITGAFGFVGKSYLDWLIEQPREQIPKKIALVSQRKQTIDTRFSEIGIQVINIQANLTKDWKFEFEPSHVLNLAADGSKNAYTEEAGSRYFLLNKILIKWLEQKSVETLFHASSGACNYGSNDSSLGTFSRLNLKLTNFVEHRLRVESEIIENAKVKNLVVARLFTFTGKHILEKIQYAVADFLKSAITNKTIVLKGNPNTIRSYLSSSDLAEWINCSLSLQSQNRELLQIGSEYPITLIELAKYISKLTDSNIIIEPNNQEKEIYLPNVSATRMSLGVSEKLDWKEQIKGLVDLLIENQSR